MIPIIVLSRLYNSLTPNTCSEIFLRLFAVLFGLLLINYVLICTGMYCRSNAPYMSPLMLLRLKTQLPKLFFIGKFITVQRHNNLVKIRQQVYRRIIPVVFYANQEGFWVRQKKLSIYPIYYAGDDMFRPLWAIFRSQNVQRGKLYSV